MTDPHLDDEQLSLLLDGVEDEGRVHVDEDGCAACRARLAALQAARDALAGSVVAPLSAEVLERIVGAALAAPAVADVVPLGRGARARRRITTPPPAWLIGAAAGLAALVGVAGLLRVADGSDDQGGSLAATVANDGDDSGAEDASSDAAATAGGATVEATAGPIDPEIVIADLSDQDDPATLARRLGAAASMQESTTSAFSAREAAPSAAVAGDGAAKGGAAAPTTSAPPDRARCRVQAEEIGAGRFSALLSTATLRWKGEPAEVLVFRLAEPTAGAQGPVTRQALVLSRPGCALLADPSF